MVSFNDKLVGLTALLLILTVHLPARSILTKSIITVGSLKTFKNTVINKIIVVM